MSDGGSLSNSCVDPADCDTCFNAADTIRDGQPLCSECNSYFTEREYERGEGLGERLEWLVRLANEGRSLFGERPELDDWWGSLPRGSDEETAHYASALRELDGQRHALREDKRVLHNALLMAERERDAALAEVDSLKGSTRRLVVAMRDRAAERDAAIERAERAEARVRELEDLLGSGRVAVDLTGEVEVLGKGGAA